MTTAGPGGVSGVNRMPPGAAAEFIKSVSMRINPMEVIDG